MSALYEHLATGITNTCRCWDLTRQDGVRFGFTDHDMDLSFDGRAYSASTGMSARALMQGTGLAVDNTEALGVLSDDAVSEADIRAGKFDGAEVQAWLVNWQDVSQRKLRFRGSIGELRQGAGAFHAELRGLTDALNQVQGRSYQYDCPAVLGDSGCRFALEQAGFTEELSVVDIIANRAVIFAGLELYEPQWFARGRLSVLSGAAAGLNGVIKNDMTGVGGNRRVDLWASLALPLVAGDTVRLQAGCDKRAATCRLKFNNFINFRGFPHLPGEDWLTSVPVGAGTEDGGSLNG